MGQQVEDPVEMARQEISIASRQIAIAIRLLFELDRRLKEWEKQERKRLGLHADEPNAADIVEKGLSSEWESLSADEQGSVLAQLSMLAREDSSYREAFATSWELVFGMKLPDDFDLEEAIDLANNIPSEAEVLARINLPKEARGLFAGAYQKVVQQVHQKFGQKNSGREAEAISQLSRGEYITEDIARQMKTGLSYREAVVSTVSSLAVSTNSMRVSDTVTPSLTPPLSSTVEVAQNLVC